MPEEEERDFAATSVTMRKKGRKSLTLFTLFHYAVPTKGSFINLILVVCYAYSKGKGKGCKGCVRLKPCPIGETLSHHQPLGYTATLLTESDDSSATTILRQAKLSLEPLSPYFT